MIELGLSKSFFDRRGVYFQNQSGNGGGEVIVIDTGNPVNEEVLDTMEELANEAETTIVITPTGTQPV